MAVVTVVDLKPPPPETFDEIAGAGVTLPDFLPFSSFLVVGAARFLYSPDLPSFPS